MRKSNPNANLAKSGPMIITFDTRRALTANAGMEEAVPRDLITDNKSLPNLVVSHEKN
jgi:hypothetical protein